MGKQRVVVGMSGGVDSSVAAALLQDEGYDVTGVYLTCWEAPGCRTDEDRKDALKVATQLGIPFQVLDFREEYRARVVEYFYHEYGAGRTPNPDVVCNREIKFGLFYDWARKHDFEYVATGHYARIAGIFNNKTPINKQLLLQRGRDTSKDQSYFLWQVPPDHLPHILFPLGEMLKADVRARAKELRLPTAAKPDSMGICFIGDVDVTKLLRDRLGERPGEVVLDGHVVGTHKGLWFYTIGERSGFTVDKSVLKKLGMRPENMKPLYVVGKSVERNQLGVGPRASASTAAFTLTDFDLRLPKEQLLGLAKNHALFVRIRNLGELYPCSVQQFVGTSVQIATQEPLFGVAEGQSGVLYARIGETGSEIVAGGGIIGV